MTPDQFIYELSQIAPSVEELMAVGLSQAVAIRKRQRYFRSPKAPQPSLSGRSAVEDLILRWDVSDLEIGMIDFLDQPINSSGVTHVGRCETDSLVLVDTTGELEIREDDTTGRTLWLVAESGGRFLGAMLTAKRFLTLRSTTKIAFDDMVETHRFADLCATEAGGEKYLDAYLMLFAAY